MYLSYDPFHIAVLVLSITIAGIFAAVAIWLWKS